MGSSISRALRWTRRAHGVRERAGQARATREVAPAVRAADRVVGRVARAAELLERALLRVGELAVGDPHARAVVADRHTGVSRKVAGRVVVAQVERVGGEQHGHARVEPLAQDPLRARIVGVFVLGEREPGVGDEIGLEGGRARRGTCASGSAHRS